MPLSPLNKCDVMDCAKGPSHTGHPLVFKVKDERLHLVYRVYTNLCHQHRETILRREIEKAQHG